MTGEYRMDKQDMRAQFEAWVLLEYPNQNMGRFSDGEYHSTTVQYCWLSWQASREAVEVELPSRPHASEEEQERMTDYEIGLGHGGCEEWDKIRKKIKEQGLKVKP